MAMSPWSSTSSFLTTQTLSEHPLQQPQFAVDYPTASHKSQMNNPWTFTSTYAKLNSLSIFPLSSLPTPIPPHTYTSFPIILMISTFIHTAVQARKLRTVQTPPCSFILPSFIHPTLTLTLVTRPLLNLRPWYFSDIFSSPHSHRQCPGSSFHISHLDSSN